MPCQQIAYLYPGSPNQASSAAGCFAILKATYLEANLHSTVTGVLSIAVDCWGHSMSTLTALVNPAVAQQKAKSIPA